MSARSRSQPLTSTTSTHPDLFTRQLADVASVLDRIDEKGRDLNQLRWDASERLANLADAGTTIDALAVNLNRKPATIRHYITAWRAYGGDPAVRAEQSFGGLSRLVSRYPNDPKARAEVIEQARREKRSVSTIMDHQGYRGGGSGIKGGRGKNRGLEDDFIRQLMALGAPLEIQEAWFGLDAFLTNMRRLVDSGAVIEPEVMAMITSRFESGGMALSKVQQNSELAAMAKGE